MKNKIEELAEAIVDNIVYVRLFKAGFNAWPEIRWDDTRRMMKEEIIDELKEVVK